MAKRNNPNDTTFRNINHLKKIVNGLAKSVDRMDTRLKRLEKK